MALPENRIMAIIEKEKHITVKLNNRPLMRRLEDMEKRGLVECADTFRDCYYYRKAGSKWRFFTEEERERRNLF